MSGDGRISGGTGRGDGALDGPVIEELPPQPRRPSGTPSHPAAPGAGPTSRRGAPDAGAGAGPGRPLYGDGALIVCDNLVRIFKVADLEVVALQGLDLLVDPAR